MDQLFSFLKIVVIVAGVVAGVVAVAFLVLLSLPKSRLRSFLLEVIGWGASAVAAVSVVSPIDAIPDFIPVLGQVDDVVAIITAILSVLTAVYHRHQRAKWDRLESNERAVVRQP